MSTQDTDDFETCQVANEAALEKGLSFCETPEARVKTLSRFLGFDADDIDADEILSLDPDDGDAPVRKRVLARTEEIIDGGEDQPLDAINEAWADVGTDFEQGPDQEPLEDDDEEAEEDPLDEIEEAEEDEEDEIVDLETQVSEDAQDDGDE